MAYDKSDKLPEFAILSLDAPINQWARIASTNDGHFLAPADGYSWTTADGKSFAFSAFGLNPPTDGVTPNAYFFTHQGMRKLTGAHVRDVNKMLQMSCGTNVVYQDVYQLDVLSILAIRYNVFFFVQDNEPAWILGCVDDCNKSVHLKVKTTGN